MYIPLLLPADEVVLIKRCLTLIAHQPGADPTRVDHLLVTKLDGINDKIDKALACAKQVATEPGANLG